MVSHNYDRNSFMGLIAILKGITCVADKKNRTVLHHICLSASIKGRVDSCTYYMRCLLDYYAKCVNDEQMCSEIAQDDMHKIFPRQFQSLLDVSDMCGDTAVNITARLGNRQLFDMLVDAGADVSIENYASLKPSDYGFQPSNSNSKVISQFHNTRDIVSCQHPRQAIHLLSRFYFLASKTIKKILVNRSSNQIFRFILKSHRLN